MKIGARPIMSAMVGLSPLVKHVTNCSYNLFKLLVRQVGETPAVFNMSGFPVEHAAVNETGTAHHQLVGMPHALGISSSPMKLPCASHTFPSWISTVPSKPKHGYRVT
ncbi:hypothetical protein MRB53_028537 [Persea americana]|uniref:Uncharacterized protein n=1 Tax=Persea americana TaxID=3435 RepID=A0ACC2KGF8_PERAE|nr:hypothetical protein MRB53_028537 [Persea americana]